MRVGNKLINSFFMWRKECNSTAKYIPILIRTTTQFFFRVAWHQVIPPQPYHSFTTDMGSHTLLKHIVKTVESIGQSFSSPPTYHAHPHCGQCPYLKIPHHGSMYSKNLIQYLPKSACIVSTNPARYHTMSPRTPTRPLSSNHTHPRMRLDHFSNSKWTCEGRIAITKLFLTPLL